MINCKHVISGRKKPLALETFITIENEFIQGRQGKKLRKNKVNYCKTVA